MTTLPHNEEAERSLIVKLFHEPKNVAIAAGLLSGDDFYVEDYRDTFKAMVELSSHSKRIDIVAIRNLVGREVEIPIESITYAHVGNVEDYVDLIKAAAFDRKVVELGENIKHIGLARDTNALARIQDGVQNLVRGNEQGNLISPQAASTNYIDTVEKRRSGQIRGFTYGFAPLDKQVQPAAPGDMVVVAARPSVGKTAFAESLADHWSTQAPYPILFVSLEMGYDQIMDRTVSRYTGIPAQIIIRGQANNEEMERIRATAIRLEQRKVWYLDDSFATTVAVRAAAAKVRLLTGGLSGIVVDYLSLLKDYSNEPMVQAVTKISRNLKAIAREYQVPMVVLSQLNRAVESRDDKHPKLYDLRESGAVEQDADVVLGLSRPLGTPYMDIEVLKNRQGPLGLVQMYFDPDRVTFHENDPHREAEILREKELSF